MQGFVSPIPQATRLSGDAAAVSALSKPGVTLELLERYHRDGVLKAKLQALGVPSDLAIDAIAGTLGKSEAPATTKAPNQTASGAEPPEEGRELAEKVTTTNQRGKMARILSQGMRQVADAVDRKDNLQEDIDVVRLLCIASALVASALAPVEHSATHIRHV